MRPPRRLFLDGLLLLMVVIWAGNYSLVKLVLRDVPPLAFNAARLAVASAVYLAALAAAFRAGPAQRGGVAGVIARPGAVTGRDWVALALLGFVGHFVYQLLFVGALARTTVANSALIIGCSPVAIALVTAAVGHERIGRLHWAGAALSVTGLYLVAGRGAAVSRASATGDAMMLGAVCCWAVYTVFSRPLLARHSPLVVTAVSMVFGTLFILATTGWHLASVDWRQVSTFDWVGIVASALLALNLAYLIWYTAVQRIGNARTSMYSNLVPVTAMAIAWVGVGEPVDPVKLGGAGLILGGVLLTRFSKSGPIRREHVEAPAEGA
jgi:drug/metabolite transporter (DMT)-like permease